MKSKMTVIEAECGCCCVVTLVTTTLKTIHELAMLVPKEDIPIIKKVFNVMDEEQPERMIH